MYLLLKNRVFWLFVVCLFVLCYFYVRFEIEFHHVAQAGLTLAITRLQLTKLWNPHSPLRRRIEVADPCLVTCPRYGHSICHSLIVLNIMLSIQADWVRRQAQDFQTRGDCFWVVVTLLRSGTWWGVVSKFCIPKIWLRLDLWEFTFTFTSPLRVPFMYLPAPCDNFVYP